MKTIELSGIINVTDSWDFDKDNNYSKIILIQSDGYRIDLVARIIEMVDSFGETGQVNYWISDKPKTKDEMVEGFLKKLYGHIEAKYDSDWHYYSTLTGGNMEYDTELKIGGHNLYNELQDKEGMFLIIELSFKEEEKIK